MIGLVAEAITFIVSNEQSRYGQAARSIRAGRKIKDLREIEPGSNRDTIKIDTERYQSRYDSKFDEGSESGHKVDRSSKAGGSERYGKVSIDISVRQVSRSRRARSEINSSPGKQADLDRTTTMGLHPPAHQQLQDTIKARCLLHLTFYTLIYCVTH